MSNEVRQLLRRSAYDSIKAMIVTGQLAPRSRVTEVDLAAKLGVSRTPIREALSRLERDGMVVARPRQGFAVIDFNVDMVREIFEIREVLDGHATEQATLRLETQDKAKLNWMLSECERLAAIPDRTQNDKFQELEVGTNLHRLIAQLSGNETLRALLEGILEKCMHYIWMELIWLDDWKEARSDHAAIVDAMCEGNAQLAGQLARSHIRTSREAIIKLMQEKAELQSYMAKAS